MAKIIGGQTGVKEWQGKGKSNKKLPALVLMELASEASLTSQQLCRSLLSMLLTKQWGSG
jgi:hypothetical protein